MNDTPTSKLDRTDPGDETQRRYKYQHGYGVILLIAAALDSDHVAIWCEQLEDILGEYDDGTYDFFQVKTRTAEEGRWKATDASFKKALRRFTRIQDCHGTYVRKFYFVSNAAVLDSDASSQRAKSPAWLARQARQAEKLEGLDEEAQGVIGSLAREWNVDVELVFQTIKKLDFRKGPSLDGFEGEIAHSHVAALPSMAHLAAPDLNAARDELLQAVLAASTRTIDGQERHLLDLIGSDQENPILLAKRIAAEEIGLILGRMAVTFRYTPVTDPMQLSHKGGVSRIEEKLTRAGLAAYIPVMRIRAASAERHLLELANQKPDEVEDIMNQVQAVVGGICADADIAASDDHEPPYGHQMLRIVNDRLLETAKERPEAVYGQTFECLAGIAGILTGECSVWWGPEFQPEGNPNES